MTTPNEPNEPADPADPATPAATEPGALVEQQDGLQTPTTSFGSDPNVVPNRYHESEPTLGPQNEPGVARWRGHTHEELYRMLHEGPGAAASTVPSRRWAELATTLTDIGTDLRGALSRAGETWTGRAAGAAFERLSGTATWASTGGESAAEMRLAVETQADHLAKARAEMPVPEGLPPAQPDPALASVVHIASATADLETGEAKASGVEQRAFDVMATYELSSTVTAGSLAPFDAPAGLTHVPAGHRRPPSFAPTTLAAALLGWLAPGLAPHEPQPEQRTDSSGAKAVAGGRHRLAPPSPGVINSARPDGAFIKLPRGRANRSETRRSTGTPQRPAIGAPPVGEAQPAAPVAGNSTGHATPTSPAAGAGTPAGTPADKLALRRFGAEAIGSNQWFGDSQEPAGDQRPRRRMELREPEQVVQSVAILGREHHLAPTVIGDSKNR